MSILCIPTTQNRQWHQHCCQQNHPKIQTIQSKFQSNSQKTTPTHLKTNHLLKRFYCRWNKTRPQTHRQKQSSQTKQQCNITMQISFFSWLKTQEKSSSQWLLQHHRKQTFKRNRQQQSCSQNTNTKYLRPHKTLLFLFLFFFIFYFFC